MVTQLTQGITPEKIALTVAVGSAVAMFPVLGTTTLLCFVVGVALKLNQPIIQALNYLLTPIHVTFVVFSLRWGERLFGETHSKIVFKAMWLGLRKLRGELFSEPVHFFQDLWAFIQQFSVYVLHACMIWLVLAPFWAVALYYLMLPIVREANRVRAVAAAKAVAEKAKDHPVP